MLELALASGGAAGAEVLISPCIIPAEVGDVDGIETVLDDPAKHILACWYLRVVKTTKNSEEKFFFYQTVVKRLIGHGNVRN